MAKNQKGNKMDKIVKLTTKELTVLLLKVQAGETLSSEQVKQVLFSISVANSEIDADLLKALKAQEQSEV